MPPRKQHPKFTPYIHTYRRERRITQRQMAIDLGISRTTLVHIEWARSAPSITLALRIAKYLGTSVDNLFTLR